MIMTSLPDISILSGNFSRDFRDVREAFCFTPVPKSGHIQSLGFDRKMADF